jgi:hypothetical protein
VDQQTTQTQGLLEQQILVVVVVVVLIQQAVRQLPVAQAALA